MTTDVIGKRYTDIILVNPRTTSFVVVIPLLLFIRDTIISCRSHYIVKASLDFPSIPFVHWFKANQAASLPSTKKLYTLNQKLGFSFFKGETENICLNLNSLDYENKWQKSLALKLGQKSMLGLRKQWS